MIADIIAGAALTISAYATGFLSGVHWATRAAWHDDGLDIVTLSESEDVEGGY